MHGQQNLKYSFWVNEINFKMNLKGTGLERKTTTLVAATVWNVNAWQHEFYASSGQDGPYREGYWHKH
jgi:hypothetical protein